MTGPARPERTSSILVIRQARFPLDLRTRRHVEALLADGHEVDVLCVGGPGERALERWHGVRIMRVPIPHRRGGILGYLLEYGAFAVTAFLIAAVMQLLRRYRLVHVHTLPDPLVFAALVPRLFGAKVLLDLRESMPDFFATRFGRPPDSAAVRVVTLAEQASIRFADHAMTCTDLLRDSFVRRGAPRAKFDVLLDSADESIFRAAQASRPERPDRFTLIMHGTIEPHVGVDTAIEALALLADELPGLELQVYGKGFHVAELERLAAARNVGHRVLFQHDWVPLDELVAALTRADAGLVALKRDAFRDLVLSLKMFELITMRRPILMSRTLAVETYFDEDSFAWFDSDDPASLAQTIRRLHGDPAWARALVERATAANEGYRWARQRAHYLEMVRRMLC